MDWLLDDSDVRQERVKGELHLSLKVFIIVDYTLWRKKYKKTISFEKCIHFFSLEA